MKKISKKYKEIIFIVTAAVILAGCVSKEQYYEDITLSRQQAYQQWKSRKKAQKAQNHSEVGRTYFFISSSALRS